MARKVEVQIVGDARSLERAFGRASTSSERFARGLQRGLTVGATALAGALAYSTKAAVEFQSSMEQVSTQAGASQREVQRLSVAVLKLAPAVGTGPAELAKALFHVESAGLRGGKALAVLRAAAEGAKIGHADLESVTNALVAAQRSAIKGAGSMQHAMAVLNATVGAGNMRMEDLTSAMSTGILPAAKAFGVTIQEVGAALGTMTTAGMPAEEAATRLRMTLSLLAAPTSKAATALKGIGISQLELAKTMRSEGLIPALALLNEHLRKSGLSATEQAQLISKAFGGGRSSAGILTLIQHVADMQDRLAQINKTTGDFGEAWKQTTQTAQFQIDKAKASLAAAAIPIGQLLLPALAKAAQGLAFLALQITEHMPQIRAGFASLERAAVPVLRSLQTAARAVAAAVQAHWPQIRAAALSVGQVIRANFAVARAAINAVMPLVKALAPLFKVAFGAMLIAIRVWAAVMSTSSRVVAAGLRAVTPAVRVLASVVSSGLRAGGAAARTFAGVMTSAMHAVMGPIHAVVNAIRTLWSWLKKVENFTIHIHIPTPHVPHIGLPHIGNPFQAGGFVPGQGPVPILAHGGEIILNPAQQQMLGGPRYLSQLFGFRREHGPGSSMAVGGKVGKKHHRAPRLPAAIREAEARAAGTYGLADDIAAYTREERWVDQQLHRHDLTGSERESLRVRRIRVVNRLKSLRRRQAQRRKAPTIDYSQIPARILYKIAKARESGDLYALRAALTEAIYYLKGRLSFISNLTFAQKTALYDALTSYEQELKDVNDQIAGGGDTGGTTEDQQAIIDQLRAQLGVAQGSAALANAFVATGVFAGSGPGGSSAPGAGGGGGQTIIFNSVVPATEEQAQQVAALTAQGGAGQPYRTSSQAPTGY